jgi:hydrogenase maturation protein HypF
MEYMPTPGEKSLAWPLRLTYAWTRHLLPTEGDRPLRDWVAARLPAREAEALAAWLESGFGLYQTSSCGRLFDAVSGLAGVCTRASYEGQAAVELEDAAWRWQKQPKNQVLRRELRREARSALRRIGAGVPVLAAGLKPAGESLAYFAFRAPPTPEEPVVFALSAFWRRLCLLASAGYEAAYIAYVFHLSLAVGMCAAAMTLNEGDREFLLAGGVFQNKLLTEMLVELAADNGLTIIYPRLLPPGDGGVAFGQIVTFCAETQKERAGAARAVQSNQSAFT